MESSDVRNAAQLVPLDEPRLLTPAERAILLHLLATHPAAQALAGPAADVQVTAVCTCGCRSLGLADDEGAARSTASPARLTIRAAGRDPDGTPVEVILHAVGGRLVELEIWPGHEGPCALPDPGTLGRVVVDVVP